MSIPQPIPGGPSLPPVDSERLATTSTPEAGSTAPVDTPAPITGLGAQRGGGAVADGKITWVEVPRDHYIHIDYPHHYFFELVLGERQKILDVIEAPLVNYVAAEYVPAYTGTFTIKSHYEEQNGFRRRVFKMAGRSGFTPTALVFFQRFRNFFEREQRRKAEHKNAFIRGLDYRLIVNMPFEGTSEFCNLTGFTWERDRSKLSVSYVWALTLETTGWATRPWTNSTELTAELAKICDGTDNCHTLPTHPCRQSAELSAEAVPAVDVGMSDPGGLPRGLPPSAAMGAIKRTADSIADAGSTGVVGSAQAFQGGGTGNVLGELYGELCSLSMESFDAGAAWWRAMDTVYFDDHAPYMINILGWFSNLTMEANNYFSRAGLTWAEVGYDLVNYLCAGVPGRLRDYANAVRQIGEDTAGAVTSLSQVINDVDAGNIVFGGRDDVISFASPSSERYPIVTVDRRTPTTTTEVIASDTSVWDIAMRLYASRSFGDQIISLNGLRDHRTWSTGMPLSPGDRLLVPDIAGQVTVRPTPNVDILGVDWRVENYDFVLNANGDDLERVTGVGCYMQNMTHRLRTVKDENPVFPGTGVTPINGSDEPQLTAVRIAADVQQQVTLDARTKRIIYLNYDDAQPGAVSVDVLVEPVASSTWRLAATYTG